MSYAGQLADSLEGFATFPPNEATFDDASAGGFAGWISKMANLYSSLCADAFCEH